MAAYTPNPNTGMDLIKKLSQGTYIDAFDYDMLESPEVEQSLVMPYGDDILGFQQLAGYVAEDDMASDELSWFESGRLLKSYQAVSVSGNVATFPAGHDIRKGDTLKLADANGLYEAVVNSVSGNDAELLFRGGTISAGDFTVIHIATEFKKGTDVQTESLTRDAERKSNKPMILKDSITYTRSDLAQIVQFAEGPDVLWSIDTSDMEARFQNQQVMAGVWGELSDAGASTAYDAGYLGMTSLYDKVLADGNTMAGSVDGLDDIHGLTRMLTANKSPKENLLLQDLEFHQSLTKALGGINRYDANSYNFGNFANVGEKIMDLNFRGFDSDGFMFAYKTWDVLNDQMYFGALDGNINKPKGMIIPAGQTPDAKGKILPYFAFVYRTGARRIVGREGVVFGQGTKDVATLAYTTEFTTRAVSSKDYTLITSA